MLTLRKYAFVLILLGLSASAQAKDDVMSSEQGMQRTPVAAVQPRVEELKSPKSETTTKSMNDEQMLVELQATLESEDFAAEP